MQSGVLYTVWCNDLVLYIDCHVTSVAGNTTTNSNTSAIHHNYTADTNESQTCTDSQVCQSQCSEGFYCNATSKFCQPLCTQWKAYSRATIVVSDVFTLLMACIIMISGSAVLIVACIRRKQVWVRIIEGLIERQNGLTLKSSVYTNLLKTTFKMRFRGYWWFKFFRILATCSYGVHIVFASIWCFSGNFQYLILS